MWSLRFALPGAGLVLGVLLTTSAAQDMSKNDVSKADAQKAPANPAAPALQSRPANASAANSVDEEFIRQQFGDGFTLTAMSKPYFRDIDGDGVEDLVIAAISRKPLLDAGEHNYHVIDPYYTFYGYGDPTLTNSFGSEDLQTKNHVILIIHGTGEQAWRSATPKAKFVVINMPFKEISVRRIQMKKKLFNAIFAEESGTTAVDSYLLWDGRQYRYQPLGVSGAND
jgi:hypothetical protein